MRGDDMILISVDDHIAEPADMFERPRARPSTATARRASSPTRTATSSGGTARRRAATSGSTPSRASHREMFNVNPQRYDEMRPGCYDVARARARHVGRRPARRAQLPELDRVLGPGAQRGSRPRRQRGHDQGLQRLARRRVVRRVPRPVHPVRDPARCSTCDARGRRGAPPRGEGLPRGHVLGEPRGAAACRRSTPAHWDPLFAACCDEGTVLCLPRRLVVAQLGDLRRRAAERADDPVVDRCRCTRSATSCGPTSGGASPS